jgi:cysteinyl-tRNA synthetase
MSPRPFLLATICVTTLALLNGCGLDDPNRSDYRQDMRNFVQRLSAYAKGIDSSFIVIPQNGGDLVSSTNDEGGPVDQAYLAAIDGMGREDLFYGYDSDNQATKPADRNYMRSFLDSALSHGVSILVTDYCSTPANMDDSYAQNAALGYLSFAADRRDLDNIPVYPTAPHNVNADNITTLSQAKNFLYILDPSRFGSKTAYLDALRATNHDVLIVDLFYDGNDSLTHQEVASLKVKAHGGTRLVVSYMSIGEAESYRYYWHSSWEPGSPSFMDEENPDWAGNYKVRYWDAKWQAIIYGNEGSYLKRILNAGFDGAYLDLIDAFEYFEETY